MNMEESINQCNELINSDIIETIHCAKCEHDCTNECIEEGCLYNRAVETVLKALEDNQADLTTVYIKGVCDEKSKWRDKIREKLKKYEENQIKCKKENGFYSEYLAVQITTLEELLNESEGKNG